MFIFRKQKFEGGHKKFEGRATKYAENPKDLQQLLKRALRKASHNKSSLSGILEQLYLLVELVKAWSKKEYQDVSKKTIIMVIATIVYFVAPLDLIPDFLIGLGIFDDVAVIGYTVKQISKELDALKIGKKTLLQSYNVKTYERITLHIVEIWYNETNLIFERNVGELVLPVEKVSGLDADPLNLIWLIPAEGTYS